MKFPGFSALWLTLAFCVPYSQAWSQAAAGDAAENAPSLTESYTPDYFTQFAPQTAADMVARLPGFEIRGGGDGERGFGEASLNILINGRRPSSKSSRANQILGRIPASNVTQIDIVDGATLNIPGLSGQVANIIVKTGELSGNWEYALRFEEGSQPQLGDGEINFSQKSGNIEAVGSLDFGQFSFTEHGLETFFDGNGTVIQDRREKIGFNTQRPRANLNLTLIRDNGHVANLNLSGERRNTNISLLETFDDQTDPDLSGASMQKNGTDRDTYEVGGDYTLSAPGLGRGGQLKLIALHRGVNTDFTSRFLYEDIATGQSSVVFKRDNEEREYIGRAEYSWQSGKTSDWSASFEGALNTLASVSELTEDGGAPTLEFVDVEETRLQGSLSRNWAMNVTTNLQASIGAEYSVIDVKDADRDTPSLFRPKGFLSVSHDFKDNWTVLGKIERSVSQLDFDLIVSDVSLADGTTSQGNDNIVPEQRWEAELELGHQNPKGLSGRATLFYDIIEDPIEQLLFIADDGTLTQGPGNLQSDAKEYGLRGNLTWVMDDVLKGLRLSAEGTVADSSVEDVITSENRSRDGQIIWEYSIDARWDIDGTPYAIESEIEHTGLDDNFRIDELRNDSFIQPEFEVSLIHKNLFGMQWTAKVQNILDFELRRERSIFDQTRNGDLLQEEVARRQRGKRFSIEITDTF